MLVEAIPLTVAPLVVITGAGSGLGRALALAFCKRGIPVVGFSRSEATLAQTSAAAPKDLFTPMVVDVANDDEVRSAFRTVQGTRGDVSILINNAAVYPHVDILHESSASFMRTIAVNLGGVVFCTRAVLETMTVSGRGRIINVGSFAGMAPAPASSAYSVSKGAARIFSQALVADLEDRFPDIVVNTWMPGILQTTMGLPGGLDPETAAEWGVDLALRGDRSLNGVEFDRNVEMLQVRSFKRRMLDTVRRRAPIPRTLGRADLPSAPVE